MSKKSGYTVTIEYYCEHDDTIQSSVCKDEELSDALLFVLLGMGVYELEPVWQVLTMVWKLLSDDQIKRYFGEGTWDGEPDARSLKTIAELCMKLTLDDDELEQRQLEFRSGISK